MASFNSFFQSTPELSNLTASEKMDTLEEIYKYMGQDTSSTDSDRANFRASQLETLYEHMKENGETSAPSYYDFKDRMLFKTSPLDPYSRAAMNAAGVEQAEVTENEDLFRQLQTRDRDERQTELARAVTQAPWQYWPTAIAKSTSDLLGMGQSIARSTIDALTGVGEFSGASIEDVGSEDVGRNFTGRFMRSFSSYFDEWNKIGTLEKTNSLYEEMTKNNPELYHRITSATSMAALGLVSGAARAAAMESGLSTLAARTQGAMLAGQAVPEVSIGLPTAAKMMGESAVAQLINDQILNNTMDSVNRWLADKDWTAESKQGIQLFGMLGLGLVGGVGIEALMRNRISGADRVLNEQLEKLGQAYYQHADYGRMQMAFDRWAKEGGERPLSPSEYESVVQAGATGLASTASPTNATVTGTSPELLNVPKPLSLAEFIAQNSDVYAEIANRVNELVGNSSERVTPEQVSEIARQQAEVVGKQASGAPLTPEESTVLGELTDPIQRRAAPLTQEEAIESGLIREYDWQFTPDPYTPSEAGQTLLRHIETARARELSIPKSTYINKLIATIDDLRGKEAPASEIARVQDELAALFQNELEIKNSVSWIDQQLREINFFVQNELKPAIKKWESDLGQARKEGMPITSDSLDPGLAKMQDQVLSRAEELLSQKKALSNVRSLKFPERTVEPAKGVENWAESDIGTAPIEKSALRDTTLSVDDRIAALSSSERLRFESIVDTVKYGQEKLLRRPLLDDEIYNIREQLLEHPTTYSRNVFEPSDSPIVTNPTTGQTGISAGWVEANYPMAARILSLREPTALETQIFAKDNVLGTLQGIVEACRSEMSAADFESIRPALKELGDVWDQVRNFGTTNHTLPRVKENMIRQLSRYGERIGIEPKKARDIVSSLLDAYPQLGAAISMGKSSERALAFADSLTKTITIGQDKIGLKGLAHEFGHLHFWHSLSSDQRIGWLEQFRRQTSTDQGLAAAYPEAPQRLADLQRLVKEQRITREGLEAALYQLNNPAEIYAEQAAAYFMDAILPSEASLTTFSGMKNALMKVMGLTRDNFEALPADTKEFFLRAQKSPDPESARKASLADIEEGLADNFFRPSSDLEAQMRIDEIVSELSSKYDQPSMEAIPEEGLTGEAPVTNTPPRLSFWDLPPVEKVALLSPEDTLLLGELNALRFWMDGTGSLDELQMALGKLQQSTKPEALFESVSKLQQEFAEAKVRLGEEGAEEELAAVNFREKLSLPARMQVLKDKWESYEAQVKGLTRTLAWKNNLQILEELTTQSEASLKFYEAFPQYTRFGQSLRRVLDHLGQLKSNERGAQISEWVNSYAQNKKAYGELAKDAYLVLDEADVAIADFTQMVNKKGPSWTLSQGEKQKATLERMFGRKDRQLSENPYEFSPDELSQKPWDPAESVAMQSMAALKEQLAQLERFSSGALAKAGLKDLFDDTFVANLSQADTFARVFSRQSFSQVADKIGWGTFFSNAIRGGYLLYSGLEYDPDGVYIPGLGHVKWNYEKAFSNPLTWALLPGVGFAAKGLRKIGSPIFARGFSKLPKDVQEKFIDYKNGMVDTYKSVFMEKGGAPKDLRHLDSNARIEAVKEKIGLRSFAEFFFQKYDTPQRRLIGELFRQYDSNTALIDAQRKLHPEILHEIEWTRTFFGELKDRWAQLGMLDEKAMALPVDDWLPYVFGQAMQKPANKILILQRAFMDGIKGTNFKGQKISSRIQNRRLGGVNTRAKSELWASSLREGINLDAGTRINSYTTDLSVGDMYYAVAGSKLDALFSKHYAPVHVWKGSEQGYTLANDVASESSPMKIMRNYNRGERRLMGVDTDVSLMMAKMSDNIAQDFRKGSLFSRLHDSWHTLSPDKAMDAQVEGRTFLDWDQVEDYAKANPDLYVQVPDKVDPVTGMRKYGKLSGSYITREAFNMIRFSEGSLVKPILEALKLDGLAKAHSTALRTFKVSKTVLQPTTHANNFLSNLFMGSILGHNVVGELFDGVKLLRLRMLDNKIKNMKMKGDTQGLGELEQRLQSHPLYSDYKEIDTMQMAESTMWNNEIVKIGNYEKFLEMLESQNPRKAGSPSFLSTLGAAALAFRDSGKAIVKWAANLYEKGDLVFKMGAYTAAKRKGMTPNDAVDYAYGAYFDYGTVSTATQFLRDTGLFPFITYISKAIPAIAKAAKDNRGKVATMLLGLEGLHLMNVAREFGADGETMKHSEDLEAIAPDYMTKKSWFGALRSRPFYGVSEEGTLQFGDLSRIIPLGDIGETPAWGAKKLERTVPHASNALSLLYYTVGQSPLLNLMYAQQTGINASMGAPLVRGIQSNLDDPLVSGRKSEAMTKLVANTFMPNLPFLPWTYSADAFMNGLVAEGFLKEGTAGYTGMNKYGQPASLMGATGSMFGVKVREVDPVLSMGLKAKSLKSSISKEKGRLTQTAKDRSVTREDLKKDVNKFKEMVVRQKERHRAERAALKSLLQSSKKPLGMGSSLPR